MGQQPNKYHISDDGKIYRINEDGSFTELGNANDLNTPKEGNKPDGSGANNHHGSTPPPIPPQLPTKTTLSTKNIILIVVSAIVFFSFILGCILLTIGGIYSSDNDPNNIYAVDTIEYIDDVPNDTCEIVYNPSPVNRKYNNSYDYYDEDTVVYIDQSYNYYNNAYETGYNEIDSNSILY